MSGNWWVPKDYAKRRPALVIRTKVLAAIRQHFIDEGFVEVETPALQVSPGIDRHIRPIRATINGAFDAPPKERFLHTSPEFAMKKLLAAGEPKIFQICHVFRDGEEGRLHHPEFTLLEWYRAGAAYETLMDDVKTLVVSAVKAAPAEVLRYSERVADPHANWVTMTVADAFSQFAGIDLLGLMDNPSTPAVEKFAAAADDNGVRCGTTDRWDDIFNRLMLELVEPALAKGPPVLLIDFPTPVGALARPKAGDPRVCERVEAYACGVELANGFSELTDADEQRRRFERDILDYEEFYGRAAPIDEDFLSAVAQMPESAGMALGIDRLVMLLTGATHIRDVLWAPVDMDT